MNLPQIKNFETLCGALAVQKQVNSSLLEVMQDPRQRNSLKVLHDTPEVWRMWLQLGEVRVNLHTIFTCEDPFMHFHPRNSIVQVIRGSYQNRTGSYNGSIEDFMRIAKTGDIDSLANGLVAQTSIINPGTSYIMLDPRNAHSVQVQGESSSSIMITGTPYRAGASKDLSRKPVGQNPQLTDDEKEAVMEPIIKFLKSQI